MRKQSNYKGLLPWYAIMRLDNQAAATRWAELVAAARQGKHLPSFVSLKFQSNPFAAQSRSCSSTSLTLSLPHYAWTCAYMAWSPRALAGALILTLARPFIRNDAAARSEGTATARRSAWERRRCSSQRREATARLWASGWRRCGSGQRMATALERKMVTALEQKMATTLKQKMAAALSRPCCWAEQGGNEVEWVGSPALLDGSERLRCSDCREPSWSPTAEDLVPSRDCLCHQRVIFYVISYLAMTGCWHSFSVRPSAWPTL